MENRSEGRGREGKGNCMCPMVGRYMRSRETIAAWKKWKKLTFPHRDEGITVFLLLVKHF